MQLIARPQADLPFLDLPPLRIALGIIGGVSGMCSTEVKFQRHLGHLLYRKVSVAPCIVCLVSRWLCPQLGQCIS